MKMTTLPKLGRKTKKKCQREQPMGNLKDDDVFLRKDKFEKVCDTTETRRFDLFFLVKN